ncbi:hypothetical protein [Niabella sp.]|uniref:sensor histidine kinase n=1 Tax=Niabella sp. TaxID=1962976 RepID=UPI002634A97F|nr:hypothetical protein [Niabella sp.]
MNWSKRIHRQSKIFYALIVILLLTVTNGYSNTTKDSVIQVVRQLNNAYKTGKLNGPGYFDNVFAVMRSALSANIPFTGDEALKLLGPYRAAIWDTPSSEPHKRNFYGIVCTLAQMNGKYGEMLYYAERINQLEQKENGRPSLTALTVIAGYYLSHASYNKVKELYEHNKTYLLGVPELAMQKSFPGNDLVQATMVLEKSAQALFELRDILAGFQALTLLNKIERIADSRADLSDVVKTNIVFSKNRASYRYATAQYNAAKQAACFRDMIALREDPRTPGYLKYCIDTSLTEWKVAFYLSHYNADSATHYINLYKELIKDEAVPYNQYLLRKYEAQNLYAKNQFKASADLLTEATTILDSDRATLVDDIDEMMYARVKAEDQQILLKAAAAGSAKSQRRLRVILNSSLIFLLIFIAAFFYFRQRQKNKFLQFKLNLARDIHDETNPALLHAIALARTSRNSGAREKTALEKNIEHTISLIRSLSYDLKSEQQYTIADLIRHTGTVLNKLNTDGSFTYGVNAPADTNRFISHYQFTELKAILNECITNTIKHAQFNEIQTAFIQQGNRLSVTYQDNGKGWATQADRTGTGIQNIKERVQRLNGDFLLTNEYPNGYHINISLQLR